jgi:hypothetical protein
MPQFLFANNADTTLAAPVTNSATSLPLAAGTGALFPTPGAGQVVALTLQDQATGLINEIVYATALIGDTFTVERAQEGTTALAWNSGDFVSNLLTAGTAQAFQQTAQPNLTTTVGALPSPEAGLRATVTDSTMTAAGNFGAAVVGGSTHTVPVWASASAWYIG